jgi:glyoxylase-like metal-dependent hydrolase (beta-lactamase superfamily II)
MPEILPGVHMVEGVDPSPDFTTHVYLVKDPGPSWTLIDTGLPGSDVAIVKYLEAHRIPVASIRSIVITHLHRDHVGGLRRMIERTKAKTYAHWIDAAFIEMKPKYDGPGTPPAEPVSVDERLKDGDRIDAGGGLVAYHTPGHTPGHTSYYLPDRKLLFSGDLFFGGGREILLTVPDFTHHTPTAQISARRISALPVEALLTYHGGPYTTGGHALIQRLVARF